MFIFNLGKKKINLIKWIKNKLNFFLGCLVVLNIKFIFFKCYYFSDLWLEFDILCVNGIIEMEEI